MLSIDTSGSMAGTSIALAKMACAEIAANLRLGDIVSVVGWDTSTHVFVRALHVSGPDDATLLAAIDGLDTDSSTNLAAGLKSAYDLAEENTSTNITSRVVLISDGGANAGATDISLIAEHAEDVDAKQIYMVGVGVGSSQAYNDALMDDVTDAGKGASLFVGDEEEVHRAFGTDFVNTLAVAARNVAVQLDLPPGFEIARFSGEEYSTNAATIEPQHLAPNDAMVLYQTIETCAPEQLSDASEVSVTARWTDPSTGAARERTVTRTFAALLSGETAQLKKGAAVYAYADALERYSRASDESGFSDARARLDVAEAALPGDADLHQIRSVLNACPSP